MRQNSVRKSGRLDRGVDKNIFTLYKQSDVAKHVVNMILYAPVDFGPVSIGQFFRKAWSLFRRFRPMRIIFALNHHRCVVGTIMEYFR